MKAICTTLYLLIIAPLLYGQIVVPRLANDVGKSPYPDNMQAVISFIENRPDTLKLSGEVTPELLKFVRNTGIPIGCLDLSEAKLMNNEIVDFAFGNNVNLVRQKSFEAFPIRGILLPEGLRRIGVNAFAGCPLQGEVKLPDSVDEIGLGAFRNCKKITSINLPKSCHTIGNDSFFGLSNWSGVLTIPAALTQLVPEPIFGMYFECRMNPFAGSNLLSGFKVEDGNPIFTTDGKSLYQKGQDGVMLLSVAPTLTGAYTVSKHIKHVAIYAFHRSKLSQIQFQRNPLTLGEACFAECENLMSLTIPSTVDLQGRFPFEKNYDEKLRTIIMQSSQPDKIVVDNYLLEDYYKKHFLVIVPKGAKKKYDQTEGWNDLSIKELSAIR